MILLRLFFEFFKTGLFALGGGLATIPFLTEMMHTYHWFDFATLTNMIAISESTPGPMGVNMATYVGYESTHSILGGIVTTFGLVIPSIIIICIVAHYLKQFKDSQIVQAAFYGLRPAVVAMIACASLSIFSITFIKNETVSFLNIILFILLFLYTKKFPKTHPIFIILGCALLGILFQL